MAAVSPSSGSPPSGVQTTPPLPSAISPLPATTPTLPSTPPAPSPPVSPPNAPPPSISGTPPVTSPPPPVPTPSPPSPPPLTPQTPPTISVSPPPPPPHPNPPVSSPPLPIVSPPPPIPPPLPHPPVISPPPPSPSVGTPPSPALPLPPKTSPSPPAFTPPSSHPPSIPPPPPPPAFSPNPPISSSPPASSKPPETSLSPPVKSPTAQPPPLPPKDSPPSSSGMPPPSDPVSAPPPFLVPGTPTPVVQVPPTSSLSPPIPSKTLPSSPTLPANKSGVGSEIANNALSKGGIGSTGSVAIAVIAGALILGLIALAAFWIFKCKKTSSGARNGHVTPASMGSSPHSDIKLLVNADHATSYFGAGSGTDTPTDPGGFAHSRSWFTFQELSEATCGFSDENLLGEGGFGCVYKGHLVDGRVVAVKQLKIGGGQGEREFKAEVEIISRIHHRHLVSLVGYSIWEREGKPVMDWATRVKIAVGAARGHPRIIHRDIKSSNILIDNNYEAQVSDFGLAKLAMDAETHVSTRVMGTFGYMAPEYATTGKLTEKSDVYSFGVVLLELITGRKPVDQSQPLGEESLVEWARPLLAHALDTGEFEELVDPRLDKNYIESEMFRMTEAAAACVRHSSSKRPRMGQIVRALGESDSGDLSNGLKVGESQLYNSAQQSADMRWFRRMAFGSQGSSSGAFSQPTQNTGFSTDSRQDVYFSAQPVQSSNARQRWQNSQNLSFSGQHGININFVDERGLDEHSEL
ncbi:hypothetical protein KSS87_005469 [Heliosperma pusillum]|nr:hypothetical protein KSS87_005469 [Heliosperma pusillum]